MRYLCKLATFLVSVICICAKAQIPVTNELHITWNFTSYDTRPLILVAAYLDTHVINMYPQFTNSLNSRSRSGAGLELDNTNGIPSICPALWCYARTNGVIPYDIWLPNDNGGYNSNQVYTQGLQTSLSPGQLYNGTAYTNEGLSFTVVHIPLGANINDVSDGDGGALSRLAGSLKLATDTGVMQVDMWHDNWTNGWNTDIVGSRLLGFFAGGHAYPAGNLGEAIACARQLFNDTNVGSMTIDFGRATCTQSNQMAAVSFSASGPQVTFTARFDHMPMSWDRTTLILNGATTNGNATDVWKAMANYGNSYRQMIYATNFPISGTYSLLMDGVVWDTATDSQWALGRNMFTNNADVAINLQKDQVLHDVLDKYGVSYVTRTNTHGAGENGVYGPDMINYQSHVTAWPTLHGPSLVQDATIKADIASLRGYDVIAHNDAQQTNHTLVFMLVSSNSVRVPAKWYGQFTIKPGVPYKFQSTESLSHPDWQDIDFWEEDVKDTNGAVSSLYHLKGYASTAARFFRMRQIGKDEM